MLKHLTLMVIAGALLTPPASFAQTLPPGTDAASLGLIDLSGDISRQDLFKEFKAFDAKKGDVNAKASIEEFDLVGPFRFPGDATYDSNLNAPRANSLFGVDISHYTNSAFPIDKLKVRKVTFLYMKATQGARSLDGRFATFWKRAGNLPKAQKVHRGAYHFLSACNGTDCKIDPDEWGKMQAETFVKVIKANGGLLPTDMPPVVDLEWDKASKDSPDRWANRSASEILATMDAFLKEVSTQLGRSPMIYTARSWWDERMTTTAMSASMKAAPLWLADYSKSSRGSEDPRTIGGAKWVIWQFTDGGTMASGFTGAFDTNIYKGPAAGFYTALGVQEFAP